MIRMLDYEPKLLHIALKSDLEGRLVDAKRFPKYNGVIYDPQKVFGGEGGYKDKYNEFFEEGRVYQLVTIITEQGPGELLRMLERDFGVKWDSCVGGIIALFRRNKDEAKALMHDIAKNPQKYFKSKEKEIFG